MKTIQIRISSILLLVILGLKAYPQSDPEAVLMTIGDRQVTLGEFERIYRKNNTNAAVEHQTVDEYLDLFINFKLKVIEAENLGYDTSKAFINEFSGYKKQLAKPYMNDKEELESILREAYERSKYDIHACHILLRCDRDADPEDTARIYNKAMEIRQRIIDGEDFATVARATSDDPSAKDNGGDLGYFTVFRMVYPFETVAYNLKSGEISMPFRTRFGYHIVKVIEKRPARGQVKVAHIMILTPENMSEEKKKEAREKIDALYDSLEAGADFAGLAKRHSEDRGSAARGGELSWFGTGRMVPEFEDAAFSLEKPGDYTKPVKTSFGWHIIKLIDRKGIGDYESMKADLAEKVNKNDRAGVPRRSMISKLKKQFDFRAYPGNLRVFTNLLDSGIFVGNWSCPDKNNQNMVLFELAGHKYSGRQFADYIESHQGGNPVSLEVLANQMFQDYTDAAVLEHQESLLPGKYPEYRNLVQEYHDGILLFDLTDDVVWSKAIRDSAGLEQFYNEHKEDYRWGKRLDAVIYDCENEGLANQVVRIMQDKSNRKAPPNILVKRLCDESGRDSACITYVAGKYEKGDNDFVDMMDWDEWVSRIFKKDNRWIVIVRKDVLQPRLKKLDEARGLITADYQNYLEMQWIKKLHKKYPVRVNRKLLSTIE